uniref:Solute carrier family 26 member 3 n=1 Tax=Cyprinus carpio TaxID=7962 RepID=A0A8C2G1C6_CYPCA
MKNYKIKQWLLGDIVSGISTGLVAVLQGLAFSLLASLPPGYGLYTAFFPAIIYFFLGTSRHLSVGAFPILSLMVGAVVTRLVPDGGPPANITGFEGLSMEQQRVLVASSVTFVMGAFQLIMGLLQVGFIVMYLSETLVSGFTTAAAVHIWRPSSDLCWDWTFLTLVKVFSQITNTNVADLVTSIVIMALVLIVKEINDRFKAKLPVPIPIEVTVTVIACGVSYAFNFQKRFDVGVVGEMANGYETPIAPNLEVIEESAVEAFPMAIVGFAVAFSVAEVYSVKRDYTIDGNQELIAFGVSNMFGASFRSFAASTALSRTAIQESTGGKTQIAGVLSAMMVLIVIVAIGFLLEPLPRVSKDYRSVSADLIFPSSRTVVFNQGGFSNFSRSPKGNKGTTVIITEETPQQIIPEPVSGAFEYYVWQCGAFESKVLNTTIYEPNGVKIFKIPSPIFFANIDFFKDKLVQAVGFSPLKVLKKRNKALQKIRKMLLNGELETLKEFIRIKVDIYIVSCDVYIMEKLHQCSFFDDEIKTSIFYPTLHDAMLHILEMHPDRGELEKVHFDSNIVLLHRSY